MKKLGGILIAKLADLVEYAICFDTLKSTRPELQNDLSYFRRLVAVHAPSNQLERCGNPLSVCTYEWESSLCLLRCSDSQTRL